MPEQPNLEQYTEEEQEIIKEAHRLVDRVKPRNNQEIMIVFIGHDEDQARSHTCVSARKGGLVHKLTEIFEVLTGD